MVSDQESVFGLTALFSAGGIYLAIALWRAELQRFTGPDDDDKPYVSHQRLLRRLLGALVIGALMVMILLGVYAIDFTGRPVLAVFYWGGFCGLVLLLTLIGVVDLLDTRRIAHLEHSRALKALLEEARKSQSSAGGAGD